MIFISKPIVVQNFKNGSERIKKVDPQTQRAITAYKKIKAKDSTYLSVFR